MKHQPILFVFYLTLQFVCTVYTKNTTTNNFITYKAGVVEYAIGKPGGKIEDNVKNYVKFMNEAATKNVTILVFPEMGLVGNVNRPNRESLVEISANVEIDSNPCLNSSNHAKFYSDLSCAVNKTKMYVVINLLEKKECEPKNTENEDCALDGYFFYNTNVVFDRNGRVIARYRKFNLFGEHLLNTTKTPDITTFDTDFGVKFGTFICFDILFTHPALDLVNQKIYDFAYPTMWFSELPFLTAIQTQHGWADSQKVNILAANANQPSNGGTGSTIYSKYSDSNSVDYINGSLSSKLIIMDVKTKNWSVSNHDDNNFESREDVLSSDSTSTKTNEHLDQIKTVPYSMKLFKSSNVDLTKSFQKTKLIYGNLSCDFSANISVKSENTAAPQDKVYKYKFVIFNGVRSFTGVATGGIQVCGIVACLNDSILSCGLRFPTDEVKWNFAFTNININGNFLQSAASFYFPSTVRDLMVPIKKSFYLWTHHEDQINFEFKAKDYAKVNLLTFAIYGRNTTQDGEDETSRGSMAYLSIYTFIIAILIIIGCAVMI